jgi:phage baseplate assembly protein W
MASGPNPTYYGTPLRLGDIIRKKEQTGLTLKESISSWIHLILVTHYGEFKNDENFGCQVWEYDFETITNSQKFKELVQEDIRLSVIRYEPRLTDVRADVQIEQVEVVLKNRRVKVRIGIRVKGIIRMTNEPFVHEEGFFMGPLSYY